MGIHFIVKNVARISLAIKIQYLLRVKENQRTLIKAIASVTIAPNATELANIVYL